MPRRRQHAGTATPTRHYRRPAWVTRQLVVPALNGLMRLGVSLWGSRVLEHRGRRPGSRYRTPVNLLAFEGRDYLVAARGETEWVRNVRADHGSLVLILGRRRAHRQASDVPVGRARRVLRAYLARWGFEVAKFFEGVGPDASDAELVAIAERHPVFVLD